MAITKPLLLTPWADAGAKTQPSGGQLNTGYTSPARPGMLQFNWLLNYAMNGVRYLMRTSIPTWDAADDYQSGAFVRESYVATDGFPRMAVYSAVGTPTIGQAPHTHPNDWELWLDTPLGQSTNWGREIWAWRNARNQRRFGIDHLGFPAGKFQGWQEDWGTPTAGPFGTGNGVFYGRWLYAVTGGFGSMAVVAPSANFWTSRNVQFNVPTGTGSWAGHLESQPIAFNENWSSLTWQCDAGSGTSYVAGGGGTWDHNNVYMGIAGAALPVATVGFAGPGLFLQKTNSNANWIAVARPVTGSTMSADTGVAADGAAHRFRIEYQGGSTGDDTLGRALFYIDGGAPKANIPFDFDVHSVAWRAFTNVWHNGGAPGDLGIFWYLGVIDFRSALCAGNVFL